MDKIDRKILQEIQQNGRISMTDLSERVHLSISPCSERVRRLERDGVIRGYHARVDPAALGLNLLVFVELTLSSKSPGTFRVVREALLAEPRVLECHLVSGTFDYLVKARLAAMHEYRELLADLLHRVPVPARSNSYVVMEEIKETLTLPIED